jgi:hypothetical protein
MTNIFEEKDAYFFSNIFFILSSIIPQNVLLKGVF